MSSEKMAYKDGFDKGYSKAQDRIAQFEADNAVLMIEKAALAKDSRAFQKQVERLREALARLGYAIEDE